MRSGSRSPSNKNDQEDDPNADPLVKILIKLGQDPGMLETDPDLAAILI